MRTATSAVRVPVQVQDPAPAIHVTTAQVRAWLRSAQISPRLLTGRSTLHVITAQDQITIRPCAHSEGCHVIGTLIGGL